MNYWHKQDPQKPLFPDIEWNRPEQKSRAGKLVILGGNPAGFAAVTQAYQTALQTGAGQIKVLLPDSLRKHIPPQITDAVFVASNPSGGLSKEARPDIEAAMSWSDAILCVGDTGRNSETAMVYEAILRDHSQPIVITRDAIDLLKQTPQLLLEHTSHTLVVSFAQLRALLQAIYYPKIVTLSMPLPRFIEAIHKVTVTYPCTLVTFFNEQLVVAHEGKVVTMACSSSMALWRGETAAKAATYLLWTPSKPFEGVSTSIL